MASLYKIEEDLIRLFDEIEENDGEVTDEQYNALIVSQEELKVKLGNYCKAIQSWNSDAKVCKEEEKRIADTRKKYENRVKRLKEAMLQAVTMFGDTGKTGNKFIELPTARVYTRGSKSVAVNEERVKLLIDGLFDLAREMNNDNVLKDEILDVKSCLHIINMNIQNQYDDDAINLGQSEAEKHLPFTMTDLKTVRVNISIDANLFRLLNNHTDILAKCIQHPDWFEIIPCATKERYKTVLTSELEEDEQLTVAAIETNDSLQIK